MRFRSLGVLIMAMALVTMSSAFAAKDLTSASRPMLKGVAVSSLWESANFVDTDWLKSQPQFVADQEGGYTGSSSFRATKPETGEPLGLEITWEVSPLTTSTRASLGAHFAIPEDANFLVTSQLNYRGHIVTTYTAVTSKEGNLTPRHLGYKGTGGEMIQNPVPNQVPATDVFRALGFASGPFVSTITVDPTGGTP